MDPRILQGQGAASATLVPVLREVVVPRFDGLAAWLDASGAEFLDVGIGMASLSIDVRCVPADAFSTPVAPKRYGP
jgi:hypothetical protein